MINTLARKAGEGALECTAKENPLSGKDRNVRDLQMKKLRIGLVGAGNIAKTHLRAYQNVENAEVVAICDINAEKLAVTAEKFGIKKTYTSETQKFTDAEVLEKAADVYDYFLANGQAKGTTYAIENGFMSPYQARAYLNRAALADTTSLDMQVLSVGDLSVVIAPYEMFSQSGLAIMDGSPFEQTLIIGYCNGSDGYISTPIGYEYNGGVGCYEAYSSPWPKGTAEKLVDEYVALLNQLKAN